MQPTLAGQTLEVPEPRSHDMVARLRGRRVELRPLVVQDYDFIYKISTAPENIIRWRFRGGTPSPETFIQSLWVGVLTQFFIARPADGTPVGLITAYNAKPRNRTTYMSMIIAPQFERSGWAMEAVPLFLRYLFDTWNLRKVYYETVEFNFAQMASGIGTRFHVEGCLKEEEYYAGTYWHVYTLAVYRDEWLARSERVLPYVLGTSPPGTRTPETE